jgi:hypothetical protein
VNGTEQRRQATVAQRLEQTSESVAVLLDALDARLFDQARKAQDTRRDVNELLACSRADGARLNRLSVAVETLRSDNAKTHDELWIQISRVPLADRTFLGRLRWLVTGR